MSYDLTLCGWRVQSALHLPELLPWQGEEKPADIEISLGPIPERTAPPIFTRPHSKVWADGAFLLELEAVGRFWVEGGKRVVIEPAADANPSELRTFLLGSALGALCHQRGLLPIHASAVRLDGRAILIAGDSGAGKSTLAAALGARGHALAADDIAAFDPANGLIWPAFPMRKLATDVLETLALENCGLVANRPGQPKFHVPATEGFDSTPLRPHAIYILRVKGGKARPEGIENTSPATALAHLDHMIYRRLLGSTIQPKTALFSALAKLAQQAPVHLLIRKEGRSLSLLDQMAAQVEAHARTLPVR